MRDKSLGGLILTASILAMLGYFWWLFLAPDWTFLGRSLREWALIAPIVVIVYLFFFILAWIGWAMVTTPPALPATEGIEEEVEEAEKEGE